MFSLFKKPIKTVDTDRTQHQTIQTGFRPDFSESPIYDLYEPGDLDRYYEVILAELARDREAQKAGLTETPEAKAFLGKPWWQRIDDPLLGISTVADHKKFDQDCAGPLHTLYGRLGEKEASLTRPLSKWLYTRRLLPELRGKSVLEIGSSCGFWSFKFAELGASKVTGIEAIEPHIECATEMAKRKNLAGKVSFINTDAFYSRIDQHDIVFYSEVLGHSLVPYHSFLRTLGLAKEIVIADEFYGWDGETSGQFFMSGDPDQELMYTGFAISENVALTLCYLAGVDLRNVKRYRNQFYRGSTLMVVDLSGAAERRARRLRHPSQRLMIENAMGLNTQ